MIRQLLVRRSIAPGPMWTVRYRDGGQDTGSTTWVQRLAAVVVPSTSNSSAEQKTTRLLRRTTVPTARSRPGRVGRRNSTRRSAVRNTSSLLSTVQHAPPMPESRMAVTRPPWITGPVGVTNPYSGVASHSTVDVPGSQWVRRNPSVLHRLGPSPPRWLNGPTSAKRSPAVIELSGIRLLLVGQVARLTCQRFAHRQCRNPRR